ncbi:MAG: carbohydrate ABC transporter permease [Alphaproteobacteria bacterium]
MATEIQDTTLVETPARLRKPLIAKRRHRRFLLTYAFLTPALIVFLLYRLIPLGWNFALSFQFWSPTQAAEFAGLYHYEEMFLFDDVFRSALKNTLIYMLTAPIGIVIALVLALQVHAQIKGRGLYRTLIFLSYPLMAVGVGIIWGWLYDEKVGLFNFILRSLGIIDQPIAFLETFSSALPSVMAAAIWQILGFFMIILLTGLQNIPDHLYEAAAIDGASKWVRFYRITLPLLRPSIFLCLIIGIIASFTSFDLIFVMTNGGPGHATELLITYIYKAAFTLTQFDYAGALTVIMFLFFVAIAVVANLMTGGEAGKVDISE